MVSPSSWLKSMGVGGQLAPFFKSVCVYFVALCVAGEGAPSPGAVACKCAPVLCLLAVVLYRCATLPVGKGRYAGLVCVGLALSALGDALLVWPQHLIPGMGAFAAAHVAYTAAFGWQPPCVRTGALAYAAAAGYLTRVVPPPGALRALVPVYAALLATTAWRGAARGGAAAAGAVLFLVSDAILGCALFAGPVPNRQVLVMSTYYMGQLGIAYSALQEPRDAPSPAPPPASS